MFVVTDSDVAAIRAAFEAGGELSAAVELRRRFAGIPNNEVARACARAIVGWTPPPHLQDGMTPEQFSGCASG
jgi:hypothetical protein